MDWDTLLGPVASGALTAFGDIIPIGVPVLVALVGLSVGLKALGKFGIRR